MKQPESKKKNMVTAVVLIGTIISGMIELSKKSATTIDITDYADLSGSGATLISVIMFVAPLLVLAGIVFIVVRLLIKSAQRQKWAADRAATAQRAVPQAATQTIYRTDSNVQPVELRDGEWVLSAPTQTILQPSETQEDTYSGSMGYAIDTTSFGEGTQISAEHQEGHEHTPDHMQTDLTVMRPSEYSTIRGRRRSSPKNAHLQKSESLSDDLFGDPESMRTAVVYAEIIGPPRALEPHFSQKRSVPSRAVHTRINR